MLKNENYKIKLYLGPGVGVFPFFKSSIIDSTSLVVKSSYKYMYIYIFFLHIGNNSNFRFYS